MPESESENWIELHRHPTSRSEVVRSIRARVNRSAAKLTITYSLRGDIEQIRLPSLSKPVIGHELWRHTCFEAFVKVDGAAPYHEFNFAPSQEWTIYAFSGYRTGAPLSNESMNPQIAVRSRPSEMELDATIKLDRLSALHQDGVLRVGLTAVIETSEGLSYWALHHPTDKPDFHNPESFVLLLDPL